ncbi:MAG TPA: AAA family ATPase [Thermoplasmata archaeon]|nr:AAA family ATPase [Thermoplasmata archaeon]
MIDRVITLGGPPGGGKTTAATTLARELNLELVSAGERFRALAQRKGMELNELSAYAEAHPEVDRALDEEMLGLARPGRLLEGRIQGALCHRRHIPAHRLSVIATPEVRAARIARRDHVLFPAALAAMQRREESEARRYHEIYGIDLVTERPDFFVDSTALAPAEVVTALREYLSRLGVSDVD